MPVRQRLADNPNGNMLDYFAGLGQFMPAGAVGLVLAMYGNDGLFGAVGIAAGIIGGLVSAWSGFKAMGRHVRSAGSTFTSHFLAGGTAFSAMAMGGLLGVVIVGMLRSLWA